MKSLKKAGLIIVLLVIGAVDVFIYWNSYFYYKAKREEDNQKKIAMLEKSVEFFPLNDLVFHELGTAHFNLGIAGLSDQETSLARLRDAVQNLRRSILINPAYPFSHFYLAQALFYLESFLPEEAGGYFDEYRKAALLAGEDSQVLFEVSKLFLSRWPELSAEDRSFTLDLLRRLMAKRDREKILTLMNIWEMNAGNYEIMEKVLPSDPQIYRFFAKFLGEKSLSLEERQKFLARAELAEFERARRENQLAETDLFYIRFQEAQYHFQTAVDLLKGIQFYQTLTGQNLIRTADFTEALKSALLNLAKCRIQQRAGLSEVEDLLRLYLSLEDKPKEVGDIEAYLRDRGVLPQRFEKSFDDLGHFAFELLLYLKQNRYREIIEIGRRLEQSFIVVPEAKKKDYVRILLLVGDSFQKVDLLYDAGDIYQKALEIDPNNLGTLLKIRQNYERLNEAKKLEEINKAIEKLMTPKEIGFRNLLLNKGEILSRSLIFDGQKVVLDLQLQINEKSGAPLIAVFFNNRVVWEEYLKNGAVSLSLETKAGENALQIMPVNQPVSLSKLTYRLSNENKNLPTLRR